MCPFRVDDIRRTCLPNGTTILFLEYRALPLVSVTLMLRHGSERDPGDKYGLADITAEGLTLGTRNMDSEHLSLEMEKMGAKYSAGSGWDASFLDVMGLADDSGDLFQLVGDMLQHPVFPDQEIAQSVERRMARLVQQRDQADFLADELIVGHVLEGTIYANPTYGTIPSLRTITASDVRSFYDGYYVPNDSTLLVIGDLNFPVVVSGISEAIGSWSRPLSGNQFAAACVRSAVRRIVVVNRPDLTQTQIRIGISGIPRGDTDYLAFKIMNYILGGGGFSSRLMKRIRSEKGYTYGIRSSLKPCRISGPWTVSTYTPTATTIPVIEETLLMMEEYRQHGATHDELDAARNFFVGSFPLRLETLGQWARELMELELYGIPFDYLASYRERIAAISLDEINVLAARHIRMNEITIVIVGRADQFSKELERFGPLEYYEYAQFATPNPHDG